MQSEKSKFYKMALYAVQTMLYANNPVAQIDITFSGAKFKSNSSTPRKRTSRSKKKFHRQLKKR